MQCTCFRLVCNFLRCLVYAWWVGVYYSFVGTFVYECSARVFVSLVTIVVLDVDFSTVLVITVDQSCGVCMLQLLRTEFLYNACCSWPGLENTVYIKWQHYAGVQLSCPETAGWVL